MRADWASREDECCDPMSVVIRMSAGDEVDRELVSRLRLAVGRLNRRLRLATNEIPPLQLSTLSTLDCRGPQRLGELAQREAVAAPTMTRVVSGLVERGFVERAADPNDARSILVAITAAGAEALAAVRSQRAALLAKRMERLSAEQRDALLAALPALEALVDD